MMILPETSSRGEHTRSLILTAAYTLFNRQGYHGTSMRQIAETAGVALGGIYNHFENKEQIFVRVLLEHHPVYEVLPQLQNAQGETLRQLLADAATRLVQRFDERLDFLNLMFIEMVEFDARHLDELFDQISPQVLEFGQRLQAWQDELRPIPLPIVMRSFLGMFFSYVITEYLFGGRLPASMRQGALDHFIDIFLHGISKNLSED